MAQKLNLYPRDRKLVWEDNFEGDALDYSKWGVEVNAFGGGNGELQIFTDRKENVRVAGGHSGSGSTSGQCKHDGHQTRIFFWTRTH